MELKEYLDYINIMVPDKANEELRRTFYSMNNENSIDNKSHNITFQNSDLSLILKNSILYKSSHHSRIMSCGKNKL